MTAREIQSPYYVMQQPMNFTLYMNDTMIRCKGRVNPTPVGMEAFPPYQKMAIAPKNNDPKEPKLCDFSYISMTNPSIPFGGSKWRKKGFL